MRLPWVNHGPIYRVRLLAKSQGPSSWRALSLDHASGDNTAGDMWSWTPLDTAHVVISRSGIDSAMEFELSRRPAGCCVGVVNSNVSRDDRSEPLYLPSWF